MRVTCCMSSLAASVLCELALPHGSEIDDYAYLVRRSVQQIP